MRLTDDDIDGAPVGPQRAPAKRRYGLRITTAAKRVYGGKPWVKWYRTAKARDDAVRTINGRQYGAGIVTYFAEPIEE